MIEHRDYLIECGYEVEIRGEKLYLKAPFKGPVKVEQSLRDSLRQDELFKPAIEVGSVTVRFAADGEVLEVNKGDES